jgi:Transposase DDE domain group 1
MLRLGADHRPSPRHRTFTIKEGKYALNWAQLSCRRFRDNQARLPMFALAYNLADLVRELTLQRPVQTWTLTTPRENLIKIGAKVVHNAKAVTFQMAEEAVPRALFAAILGRIGQLSAAPNPGCSFVAGGCEWARDEEDGDGPPPTENSRRMLRLLWRGQLDDTEGLRGLFKL